MEESSLIPYVFMHAILLWFYLLVNKISPVLSTTFHLVQFNLSIFQKLSYRERTVKVSEVNTKMGFSLEGEEMASLLVKMSLKAKALDQHTLHVSTLHSTPINCILLTISSLVYLVGGNSPYSSRYSP